LRDLGPDGGNMTTDLTEMRCERVYLLQLVITVSSDGGSYEHGKKIWVP
jgi:hypothetical protein